MGDKEKDLSIKEYINDVKPYLSDIVNNYKAQGKWRVHSGNTMTKHKNQENGKFI